MFPLFLATVFSLDVKIVSDRTQIALDNYGFEQGGKFSLYIYLPKGMNCTLALMTREGYTYVKNRNIKLCDRPISIGNVSMSNISDQITFINWTGQVTKPDVYQPVISICSDEVQPYSIIYKAHNPISHIDSRFQKASFISEIFALLFLFFSVVGILNWALHPQFLIPVLISNTLTSISASFLFTSYYIYYTKLPIYQITPLGIRIICSALLCSTFILSLITGHMTACGFSIISLDLHTKSAIINIITTLIVGVCIFILDLHINHEVSLVAGFMAAGAFIHILYTLLNNLSNLVKLRSETSDQTSTLKIKLAVRANLTWVCSLIICLFAALQEIGQNLLLGLSISLAAQNGGLCFIFSFSGGYSVEDEIKNDNDLVYIEEPTSKKSLSFIAAEMA